MGQSSYALLGSSMTADGQRFQVIVDSCSLSWVVIVQHGIVSQVARHWNYLAYGLYSQKCHPLAPSLHLDVGQGHRQLT